MNKKVIVFCAEYVVALQGVLLLVLSVVLGGTVHEKLLLFLSGSLLLVIALLIMKILKRVIHKKRPPVAKEYFQPVDTYAFPSGHTTGLMTLTYFMFEKSAVFGLMAVLIAFVVMTARIKAHVHDIVDILGGVLLGISVAYVATPYIEALVSQYLATHMF